MAEYSTTDEQGKCIFCKIAAKEIPAYIIWESRTHIAFLSPYPNTEGFSVVIPKEHQPSAVLELPQETYQDLMTATKEVAGLLQEAFEDVGRVGLLVEGLGINHAHTKLMPLHGTQEVANGSWKQYHSQIETYFDSYKGYISSHDGPSAKKKELENTKNKILAARKKFL